MSVTTPGFTTDDLDPQLLRPKNAAALVDHLEKSRLRLSLADLEAARQAHGFRNTQNPTKGQWRLNA